MQMNGLGTKTLEFEMRSSRGEARALGWGLKIPELRSTLASLPQAGKSTLLSELSKVRELGTNNSSSFIY